MKIKHDFLSGNLYDYNAADLTAGVKYLTKARRLLERGPERWTKGDFAKAKDRVTSTFVTEKAAFCFCAQGAIQRVGGDDTSGAEALGLQLALNKKYENFDIATVNDRKSTDYDTILNAFDFGALLLKDEAATAKKKERAEAVQESSYWAL